MKTSCRRLRICLLGVVIIGITLLLQGETYFVSVDGSGFSPASLTIQAGDTVQWENVDDFDFPHTTTSTLDLLDPDYWNYLLSGLGDTAAKTFYTPGVFSYTDQADVGIGTITVNPALAPVINLEAPRLEAGQFLFDVTGLTVGKSNVLFFSTNLTTWVAQATNVAADVSMTFTNPISSGSQFYRVAEMQ